MKLSPMKIRNISIAILGILPFLVRGQASEKYNPNVKEIIVICKTHFDIGFTHRVKDIVNYYQTDMIDNAFKAMDASERAAICMDASRVGIVEDDGGLGRTES